MSDSGEIDSIGIEMTQMPSHSGAVVSYLHVESKKYHYFH